MFSITEQQIIPFLTHAQALDCDEHGVLEQVAGLQYQPLGSSESLCLLFEATASSLEENALPYYPDDFVITYQHAPAVFRSDDFRVLIVHHFHSHMFLDAFATQEADIAYSELLNRARFVIFTRPMSKAKSEPHGISEGERGLYLCGTVVKDDFSSGHYETILKKSGNGVLGHVKLTPLLS